MTWGVIHIKTDGTNINLIKNLFQVDGAIALIPVNVSPTEENTCFAPFM